MVTLHGDTAVLIYYISVCHSRKSYPRSGISLEIEKGSPALSCTDGSSM